MTVTIEGIGKITASADVINYLSLIASEASSSYKNRNRNALSDGALKIADATYDALAEKGYYK